MALSPEAAARFNAALRDPVIEPAVQEARDVVAGLGRTDHASHVAASIAANLLQHQHPEASAAQLFAMAATTVEAVHPPLHEHYTKVREGTTMHSSKNSASAKDTAVPHPFVPRPPELDRFDEEGVAVTGVVYSIFDNVISPVPSEIKQPVTTITAAPQLVFQL